MYFSGDKTIRYTGEWTEIKKLINLIKIKQTVCNLACDILQTEKYNLYHKIASRQCVLMYTK